MSQCSPLIVLSSSRSAIIIVPLTYLPTYRELWDGSDAAFAQPQRSRRRRKILEPNPSAFGDYQLIRMELCRHGDLEGYLR